VSERAQTWGVASTPQCCWVATHPLPLPSVTNSLHVNEAPPRRCNSPPLSGTRQTPCRQLFQLLHILHLLLHPGAPLSYCHWLIHCCTRAQPLPPHSKPPAPAHGLVRPLPSSCRPASAGPAWPALSCRPASAGPA
jgi:hypothetical protein